MYARRCFFTTQQVQAGSNMSGLAFSCFLVLMSIVCLLFLFIHVQLSSLLYYICHLLANRCRCPLSCVTMSLYLLEGHRVTKKSQKHKPALSFVHLPPSSPHREVSVTRRPVTLCLGRSWWWFWLVWNFCRSERYTPSLPTRCRYAAPCWRSPRAFPPVATPTMWRSACVLPITSEALVRWGTKTVFPKSIWKLRWNLHSTFIWNYTKSGKFYNSYITVKKYGIKWCVKVTACRIFASLQCSLWNIFS